MKKTNLILFFVLLNIVVSAQNSDTILMREIVVRDTNFYSGGVFIAKDRVAPSKSTGDLLQQIPGVTITKRSAFSIEPTINAFKYEQVNTIVNGGMTGSNSCPNRMDPVTTRIAPDNIKKVEVVRGPYEVKYGQIMGGFVNLITAETPDYDSLRCNGAISSEYNFNGNGKTSAANIRGGNRFFDMELNANYRKQDNYVSGDGTEISSAFETYGFDSGLGINITGKQRVHLNYIYSRANDIMHAGLPMDAKYDKSNMLAFDYEFNNRGNILSAFKLKLFTASEDHLMTNEYRPSAVVALANTPVFSNDFGGRFEFIIHQAENSIIYVGADLKHTAKDGNKEVTQFKNPCVKPPTVFDPPKEKVFEVWQNSWSSNVGAFIDYRYYLAEKVILKTGFRSDYITSDIKSPEADFLKLYDNNIKPDNILNFNYFAQVKFFLPHNFDVEISAGHGTRNPSLLERYINHFTVGLDAYEYVGNPHLKSESNNQVNIMVSKKSRNIYTYIDLFYSQINNYITAVEDRSIPRKFTPCKEPKFAKRFVNIDKAQQFGFNAGAKVIFLKDFNANIDINYVYAENLDLDEPLPEIAPFTALSSVQYKTGKFQAAIQNEFQAKQTRISKLVGEKESEAFSVFNLNFSYLFFGELNLGAAINNIFNNNYYRHLSRPYKKMDTASMFYEPGRNIALFLKYNF